MILLMDRGSALVACEPVRRSHLLHYLQIVRIVQIAQQSGTQSLGDAIEALSGGPQVGYCAGIRC